MALIRKILFIFLAIFLLSCSKGDINPRLVDYIKAERELRKKISQDKGLEDSLTAMKKRLKLNKDKELKQLEDRPDLWVKFLNMIDGEK
ncbi:MAG: hypothetical protein N3A65_06930 [candidate division WOR-3 bacterium]|nr:hypothetical protein [candidate division WOR-3 bacterium]